MRARDDAGGRVSRRLALFIFVYVILLFHISGYIGNEMATTTLSVSMAVVEEGRLTIDSYIDGARELAYRDGHFYSGMPPGQAFIGVPLYFVLRPAISTAAETIGPRIAGIEASHTYDLDKDFAVRRLLLLVAFTVLITIPCAAATCVMVVDLAERVGKRVGALGVLLLPLCTIWWSYGTEYGPRVMGGFMLLLPIWWVFVGRDGASERRHRVMAVACGAGLAMAPLIRYEMIFPVLVVGLWLVWKLRWRRSIVVVLAGLAVAGPGAAYHYECFGSPTATAYSQKIWGAEKLEPMTGHSPEGLPIVMYEGREHVIFDQSEWLALTFSTIPEALWSHPESLLRFSPFLILLPWGTWLLLKTGGGREVALLSGGILAAVLLVLALMPNAGIIGTIGPRYLLWALPAMTLLTLSAWNRLPQALRWLLFAASFAPSYLAAMLTSHTRHAWSFWQLREFGLTNYTLSRMQEAGVIGSPMLSTAIVLVFWAIVAAIFLRSGSRWCICGADADTGEMTEDSREGSA
ncbi:MAG: hypothetical protein ACOCX2_01125 [Armatimonadota bacterium]